MKAMSFSSTTGALTPGLPFPAQPAPVAGAPAAAPDQSALMAMVTALSRVMAIFASMQAGTMVQPAVAGGGAATPGIAGVMPQAGDGLAQLISPTATTFGGGATLAGGTPIPIGAGAIAGGGPTGGGVTTILNAANTGLGGALPSYFSVSAPTMVVGGGGGGGGVAASTSLGGAAISYFSVVDPMTGAQGQAAPVPGAAAPAAMAAPGAVAAPAPAMPVTGAQPAAPQAMTGTAGGGAVAPGTAGEPATLGQWGGNLDPQYVQGTPQPNGLIDQLLKLASPTAMPAMSGGTWMWLSDAAGARIMAHVHGQWAQHPEQIPAAIASGRIMVHYHGDTGTLHLHDVK